MASRFLKVILLFILFMLFLNGSTINKNVINSSSDDKSEITRAQPPRISSLAFTDITGSALGDTQNGTHCAIFADVTGDNRPDLYMTRYLNYIINDLFYRNTNGSVFSKKQGAYGIADSDYGSHGACFADFDNDGDYDLLNGSTVVRAYNGGPVTGGVNNNLYRNNNNTNFTDVTPTSMLNRKEKTRATLALDMDNNGYLDIFTVTGPLGTDDPSIEDNEIYLNNGGWSFTAITVGAIYHAKIGQGATDTDYDRDGDIDIITANRTGDLVILKNDGSGTFFRINPTSTIGINHRAEDGITMGDVDNDGDLDMVLVSADPSEAYLYYNKGDGTFEYNSEWWVNINGYMGGFADLDNDCDLDLVFAGDETYYYLLNDGNGDLNSDPSYVINYDESAPVYEPVEDPRAIAFADIDDDGDMDFAFGDKTSKGRLIRNDLSSSNHWLKLKLISPQGQAGAFGAKAYVYAGGIIDEALIGFREARSSNGYLGQNDPVLHFGLGANETVDVLVKFLDGSSATQIGVAADQTITIDQSDVMVELKVFIEGPYNAAGDTMTTTLNDYGFIPTTSPYSEDPRTVAAIPDSVADWILVQLRETSSGTAVASKSAFLHNDGRIVADDGSTGIITMNVDEGGYFIVVDHRNHIPIMSSSEITLNRTSSTLYDFTTGLDKFYGSGAKQLDTSPLCYGMYGGDTNENTFINSADYLIVKSEVFLFGYYVGDGNMSGVVNSADYLVIKPNVFQSTQVP